LFSKNRHLRGLKRGSGNSDDQHPEHTPSMSATSVSPEAAANDSVVASQAADKSSSSWPFAYALALAMVASAVLWAAVAVVIHYF
jgi:hypothetical protein